MGDFREETDDVVLALARLVELEGEVGSYRVKDLVDNAAGLFLREAVADIVDYYYHVDSKQLGACRVEAVLVVVKWKQEEYRSAGETD